MLQVLINLDIKYLNLIQRIINPSSHLQVELVKLLTDSWVILVMILLIWLWLYWVYKKQINYKEIALMIFYSISFSFIIYLILNQFLPLRPRPESVSTIRPLVDHLPDNSFPSWHAIFAWAAILSVFLYQKRKCISYLILIFSILMLVARIIAGIHYPWDILVWIIIWLLWAEFVYYYRDSILFTKYLLPYPIKLASFIKL